MTIERASGRLAGGLPSVGLRVAPRNAAPLLTATLFASVFAGPLAGRSAAQDPIARVSVDSAGNEASQAAWHGTVRSISDDGRFVLFNSLADDLVADDTNGVVDHFVRDLLLGTTVRVNVSSSGEQANAVSNSPSMSGDGRFVMFDSYATNLVSDNVSSLGDVFVRDRDPDGDGIFDVGGITELVSFSSSGAVGNSTSSYGTISDDGNFVAFTSRATNLIPIDNNDADDIFLRNRSAGTTTRVSINDSNVGADDDCGQAQISGDGNYVIFLSLAENLAPTSAQYWDVFVRDRITKTTRLVDADVNGVPGNSQAFWPSISRDGRYACFHTQATNLWPGSDTGTTDDVFRKDLVTGVVDCASIDLDGHSAGGNIATISADGNRVAFWSNADHLVPHDANVEVDVFVRDFTTASTVCVNVDCTGTSVARGANGGVLSGDGRFVVFNSQAEDLVPGDTNGVPDVFINDLANLGFQASWRNYGSGWPGTHGTPTLTADRDPEFGATVTVHATNSLGKYTAGFLLVGNADADVPTNRGGSLLVDFFLFMPVLVPPSGFSDCADIAYDIALCGTEFDVQVLEIDPGASQGISFTAGLELVIGR